MNAHKEHFSILKVESQIDTSESQVAGAELSQESERLVRPLCGWTLSPRFVTPVKMASIMISLLKNARTVKAAEGTPELIEQCDTNVPLVNSLTYLLINE